MTMAGVILIAVSGDWPRVCGHLTPIRFGDDSQLSLIGAHAFFWSALKEITISQHDTSV
jgi:hypothetical protein